MKLHILPILTFLCVGIVVSNASLSPELYWKEVLVNANIPKAIWISLPKPEYIQSKTTNGNVDKSGAHENTDHGGGGTTMNVGPHSGVGVTTGRGRASVNWAHTNVNLDKPGPKKKPVYAKVKPNPNEIWFKYAAATEAQLNDEATRAVFMQEKDLIPGYQTSLHFTLTTTNAAMFLPRQVADSIPFSSEEMSTILEKLSVDPNSDEARIIKQAVEHCESKSITGEEKYCATSLESMIDHVTSTLGKNVRVVSTETSDEKSENKMKKYVIGGVIKIANEGEGEVCHKLNYAYAMFYCHKNKHTTAYMVSLMGEGGSNAKAVVVCHRDTSGWNPQHLGFKVLKVLPGTMPVCHYLPEDHVVWIRNKD